MHTLPAMLVLKEVHDIGDQLWLFIGLAVAVILLSWALIRMNKWLAVVADVFALLSAWVILHEVWRTEGWLDHSRGETLVPGYLRVALASAAFPILAITVLLAVKKARPNQRPERNAGAASVSASTPTPGVAHP